MALTRDFKQTILARARREPEFAVALLEESANALLSGDAETARAILRDLVNATIGFERLASLVDKPSKSLHRMLSARGNPGMDNLAAIFAVLRQYLKVDVQTHAFAKPGRIRQVTRKRAA